MKKQEVKQKLMEVLATCTHEQFRSIWDVYWLGTGACRFPRLIPTEPAELPPDRREVAAQLMICIEGHNSPFLPPDEFDLPRAGTWEAVLATVIVESDWKELESTANELREAAAAEEAEAQEHAEAETIK